MYKRQEGKGPAWANSLFEDNAEHGLGMYLGQKAIRNRLAAKTEALIAVEWARPELKEAAQKWLDTMAVSYTHLDGYKRQHLCSLTGCT